MKCCARETWTAAAGVRLRSLPGSQEGRPNLKSSGFCCFTLPAATRLYSAVGFFVVQPDDNRSKTMNPAPVCPECGTAIPADVLAGLCPRCAARMAMASADSDATSSPATRQAPLPTVRYFGDYELLEELGRGGMGVVYKARQVSLDRFVAVKMILAGQLATEAEVKRFHAEAETAASLQHPNIVSIHEVGVHDGLHYFSMDYVEGTSLDKLVGTKALPPERAAGYVEIIADAIHYAHQRGVLHRDLKPSNILIDSSDQPRITDFGLAKRLAPDVRIQTPDAGRAGDAPASGIGHLASSSSLFPARCSGRPATCRPNKPRGIAARRACPVTSSRWGRFFIIC